MVRKQILDEQTMAFRVAKEFEDGMAVNLGVGTPTLAANFVAEGKEVLFHTEAGALGYGPVQPKGGGHHLINASGQPVHSLPGMSVFDHPEAFSMIRGGHIDIAVLGAMEVSERGDLANWRLPGRQLGGIGGAMDLAVGPKKVIVVMTHVTKEGALKILKKCSLPLTATEAVNLIVTDIAVIEVGEEGLILKEVAPGWTADEVQALTEPKLIVDVDLKEIQF